jgi:hypothetical protein
MNDASEKAYAVADSWLNILVPPEGELTIWLWSEAKLTPDFLDKAKEFGLVLELKSTSPCG